MIKTELVQLNFVGRDTGWEHQGCSGAGTRRNGVPTPSSCFGIKLVWSCFEMASFMGAFPHLFVSTTSMGKHNCSSFKY